MDHNLSDAGLSLKTFSLIFVTMKPVLSAFSSYTFPNSTISKPSCIKHFVFSPNLLTIFIRTWISKVLSAKLIIAFLRSLVFGLSIPSLYITTIFSFSMRSNIFWVLFCSFLILPFFFSMRSHLSFAQLCFLFESSISF